MNLIKEEKIKSKKYMLKIDEKGLVELTEDNVARVEAMINTDSKYKNISNDSNKKSSAYWGKQLKSVLIEGKERSDDGYEYEKIIEKLINTIDSENSTHLNSDKCGRKSVKEKILNLDKQEFINYLKQPTPKYELIDIIQTPSKANENHHFSFATKFCHYTCLYLFENEEAADNFSIYDNILKDALPKYIEKYLGKHIEVSDYEGNYGEYIKNIDNIIKVLEQKISRNGFDHLIWYFHKGN